MDLPEPLLDSPVTEKIAWAREILRHRKQHLFVDKTIEGGLLKLREAVDRSRSEMSQLGIGDLCRVCDERDGGSCCGAGIERHYSAALIALNLLLGVEIPEGRQGSKSCRFLSESGCLLLARHVICVNYLCTRITSRIGPDRLAALRGAEGIELNLVFSLHERLRKKLSGR